MNGKCDTKDLILAIRRLQAALDETRRPPNTRNRVLIQSAEAFADNVLSRSEFRDIHDALARELAS